ncbi:MAG: hypothetical protein EPN85_00210 [Bacteroidetes bacterium]|nr:MAG: hypothetical protein EPN85_00210 [Bacteroidota bacterium]
MKKLIIPVVLVYCLLCTAYSFGQVKVAKATNQKTIAGMGGVFMNYEVGLTNRFADSLVVDSIRTIAGKSDMRFYYNKTEKNYCELAFGYALAKPEKCKVCSDAVPNQSNLTKGVIIYYHLGKKNGKSKVKKFKQLEDKIAP